MAKIRYQSTYRFSPTNINTAKFRQIDAQAIWKGERDALRTFHKAFYADCEGDGDLFLRIYGWKQEALTKAILDCADSDGNEFGGFVEFWQERV